MSKHLIIPDTQVRPGDNLDYLERIGRYIVDKQPDVLVQIGDFADMPSLSSYDVGKKSYEGRRYQKDIEASLDGMKRLLSPIEKYNAQQRRNGKKQYKPRMVLTYGNHEDRITRAINSDPKLDGLMDLADLAYESFGWETHDFLEVVPIDGVVYSHYFVTGVAGRPASSAQLLLNKKHMSCIAGHQQGRQSASAYRADGKRITAIIAGSCLTPDHKVLTADLQYVQLGDIKVGDKLVSFEELVPENQRSRRYKTGTVQAVKLEPDDVYQVTLESGKSFKVTSDHKWFVKTGSNYHWRTTDSLRVGTCIPKLLDEWETMRSYEAGWLAGIYDGEGSLYRRTTTHGHNVMQLSVSQKEGPVLSQIGQVIKDLFDFESLTYSSNGRDVRQIRIQGGAACCAKVLGAVRPQRLLAKFSPETLGRINCPDWRNDKIVSIIYLGKQDVVRIAIDEKTMIVEGYGHHNCYEHNEDYLGPQGNNHWRGLVVLHDVHDGEFDEMYVTLKYLENKYGK